MSSRPSRGAARLAAILDALPDGLVLVNCNGTVVNANTIALELFEAPGTALVGRGLLDLLPSFDSQLIPGSMRRPEAADPRGRTKPTRMIARRTDGAEFPVEVTSASLEDGREAYASQSGYTGDELLMLVVRDLSGTVDTEAELARSQRQTEMILRAAAEGVVGTDTEGRVVLVNPAAAQILGFRASDLGGQELHPLILHSRPDGEPFPYEESPLADTLKSGRKHRVRGQVLWSKNGARVPVDLTTAPVRDGDQLVGAVMTFTDRRPHEDLVERHAAELKETAEQHAAELADNADRAAAELEASQERYAELAARHAQLTAVLGGSLRGPLEELRAELGTLAADPAGQLWPEANQILHHLAAGYARMTTLVDNVLSFQRLDTGAEGLQKAKTLLDEVVAAGVEGAVELIGPGRAQFAVHAPPVEAEVDGARLATALAHLIADVAGVDSTGKARAVPGGGYGDSTIVVAAAQRGDVVRIEVRGPYAGGDPVHEPIVRGIVLAHGGLLQTHEMPGMGGSAYVLELPLGEGAGTVVQPAAATPGTALALPGQQTAEPVAAAPAETGTPEAAASAEAVAPVEATGPTALAPAQALTPAPTPAAAQGSSSVSAGGGRGGRRRARRASTDAFLESPVAAEDPVAMRPTGRRRAAPPAEPATPQELIPAQAASGGSSGGTGRRRGRPSPAEEALTASGPAAAVQPAEGSVVTAAEGAASTGRPALGETVPPQGVPVAPHGNAHPNAHLNGSAPSGRPARAELPAPGPAPVPTPAPVPAAQPAPAGRRARRALAAASVEAPEAQEAPEALEAPAALDAAETLEAAEAPAAAGARESAGSGERAVPHSAFALPPAASDRFRAPEAPAPAGDASPRDVPARHEAVRTEPGMDHHHTPPQPHPLPTGRRRARPAAEVAQPLPDPADATSPADTGSADAATPAPGTPVPQEAAPVPPSATGAGEGEGTGSVSLPLPPPQSQPQPQPQPAAQPLPAEAPAAAAPAPEPAPTPAPEASGTDTQGRAFSVRTLGQGVPYAQQAAQQATPPHGQPSAGSGRRRKLATRPDAEHAEAAARRHATQPPSPSQPQPQPEPAKRAADRSEGRAYAISAPDEGAEGPEPLDGPGGAVEVSNRPQPQPVDDELPPEPLDNPRRLLVWPAPDVSTQQALSDRGYRPVVVHSREEVDAQIAAFPAALFVDPLTGPITRTALQSLRQAAVAAEVPVLVTAGLGQATREAAYGADPAVLLKALAPRDSEQHPSRVLLIEESEEIALALTETLERRGMQVARAGADADAVALATQVRPNLVVMDLMQVRRRRAGIIDWLRANGQLNRTPLVVYTSAELNRAELPRLSSGETVLFLAERSTSPEVQTRIVDLLAKIGTN
ncbi:hybrid sensor histidine kinase/response regulator [Streptomyces sp. MUM 178J]|uniref:hybrid sensor histidine kinase/response regulator n=1 Tax=Streptomyces sp. MUM 178J TaxID=2791991 RepID=UPI001F03ED22|nr:PAS domain-containing protein [Streptomyces sp. MUM 178J]WRQ82594.1 PAS domain-containing protein [Streptomyces sp. MUM 178J]